jgi:polysaccharide chain length determinant protein (PEP-CTERM system associated)
MNRPQSGPAMTDQLREVLDSVRAVYARRKWLALAAFVVPVSAAIGIVMSLPSVYKASAVVLVERQQATEGIVKSTVTSGLDTRLRTISTDVLKRARLENLIERFGLYRELRGAPLEAVVDRMRSDITVGLKGVETVVRGGTLVAFTVTYQGNDRAKVAQVANSLASYYLEENTRVREREASGTASFLRRQLEDVKRRLETQEQRLSAFKRRHLGETPQQMEVNLSVLDRLNNQLRLNGDKQNRAMERREALAGRLAAAQAFDGGAGAAAPSGVVPPQNPIVARLVTLRNEVADLKMRYSDRYPDVAERQAEIANLEEQLAKVPAPQNETAQVPAPTLNPYAAQLQDTLREAEAEIKALGEEERRLRQDLALYQARVENTPRREQEFLDLSRDYDTTRELYQTLLKRYEEAQLAESLELRQKGGEQFRISESAAPPDDPFAPKRARLLLMGLMLSAALAVGVAFLAEQFDTSFHSVDELRAFSQKAVLASIPLIVTRSDDRRHRRRRALAMAAVACVIVLTLSVSHLVGKGNEDLVWLLAKRGL